DALRRRRARDAARVLRQGARGLRRGQGGVVKPDTKSALKGAVEDARDINVTLISVPAADAALEAHGALDWALHVFLSTTGVAVADGLAAQPRGPAQGLLVMGPDCRTAIIDGHALGLPNEVARGPIGIVGDSGTGVQEIAPLVHRFGGG